MKKICVFGASITSGYNDEKNGGWCDLLKSSLFENNIFVFNLGIAGNTTDDLLKRLDNECKIRNPACIMIGLGTNDSKYYLEDKKNKISIDKFEKNLEKIIKIAKLYSNNIVFIGLTKVNEKKIDVEFKNKKYTFKNKYIKQYDYIIKKVANRNNIIFVDTFELDIETSYDGLHPNSNGHKSLFDEIKKNIQLEN